jgi:AcrR family transcriptional regulator
VTDSTNPRGYNSPLRQAQAEQTRQKIVDAVFAVVRGGLWTLTMPAVAKAAGVSLPTVYRYFPDKDALIEGAADDIRRRVGVTMLAETSFASFIERLRTVASNIEAQSDGMRILAANNAQGALPEEHLAGRRAGVESAIRDAIKGTRGRDRKFLIDWAMMVASSPMATTLSRFGFEGRNAADRMVWLIETLMLGVRTRRQSGEDAP